MYIEDHIHIGLIRLGIEAPSVGGDAYYSTDVATPIAYRLGKHEAKHEAKHKAKQITKSISLRNRSDFQYSVCQLVLKCRDGF